MSDFKKVNEFRKDLIRSLAYWCFSPFGIFIVMLMFDLETLVKKLYWGSLLLALFFLCIGVKCINKVYEINLREDLESKNESI